MEISEFYTFPVPRNRPRVSFLLDILTLAFLFPTETRNYRCAITEVSIEVTGILEILECWILEGDCNWARQHIPH